MVTPLPDPQIENAMEIAVMIEEIGGEAAVITWLNPAAVAAQVIGLDVKVETGVLPGAVSDIRR